MTVPPGKIASINFSANTLNAIPPAEPGRRPLSRRASAPQPASLGSVQENTQVPCKVNNFLRLQLQDHTAWTRTVKVFAPFTQAQDTVLRIFEPATNLEGDFVLEVYDRRFSYSRRRDCGGEWNECIPAPDVNFENRRWDRRVVKFFVHVMADSWLEYGGESADFSNDEGEGEYDGDDDNEEDGKEGGKLEVQAYDEMRLQVQCLKMYRIELEFYRRARQRHLDGIDIGALGLAILGRVDWRYPRSMMK